MDDLIDLVMNSIPCNGIIVTVILRFVSIDQFLYHRRLLSDLSENADNHSAVAVDVLPDQAGVLLQEHPFHVIR